MIEALLTPLEESAARAASNQDYETGAALLTTWNLLYSLN